MDVSVLIPCYNEAPHLKKNVSVIIKTMDTLNMSYEFVFVDDHSCDGTQNILREIQKANPSWRFQFNEVNKGRGRAVSDAIGLASGRIAGFIDIDLEIPSSIIPELIRQFESGYDIVMPFRKYKINLQSLPRFIISRGYNFIVRRLFKTRLKDTEAGCKFFLLNKIMPILKLIRSDHWFWDTEIMIRSERQGLKIKEVKVDFIRDYKKKSTVRYYWDIRDYLIQLYRLKKELMLPRKD